MQPQVAFGISVLLGLVVWGMIGARYIWPALRDRPGTEALRPKATCVVLDTAFARC